MIFFLIKYKNRIFVRYHILRFCFSNKKAVWQRPTLARERTTLGAEVLNFCVRDGNRCVHFAIVTRPSFKTGYTAILAKLSPRPISTSQLNTSPCLHPWPINLIIFEGSYSCDGKFHLRGGFTLRCFQRLSLPLLATQLWPWQTNWCTIGASIPVLSY